MSSDMLTPTACMEYCFGVRGLRVFGMEYGRECFCGAGLHPGAVESETRCTMKCAGDAGAVCGGSSSLSVWEVGVGGVGGV